MNDKQILRDDSGLIQLRRCPQCLFLVREADVAWSRQPTEISDDGEIKHCRFCAHNEANPKAAEDYHEQVRRFCREPDRNYETGGFLDGLGLRQ